MPILQVNQSFMNDDDSRPHPNLVAYVKIVLEICDRKMADGTWHEVEQALVRNRVESYVDDGVVDAPRASSQSGSRS